MELDPIATLLRLSQVLDALGVSYCVSGSLASSYYGIPRATNDVDVVAGLGDAFMIDAQAVHAAIVGERSFNVIEYATLDKVDVFIVGDNPWSQMELQRRQQVVLSEDSGASSTFFASPEDVILSKLAWYRRGGEVSDRQWLDLLSVMTVQSGAIDREYLQQWATVLGVQDLLARAIVEAGVVE